MEIGQHYKLRLFIFFQRASFLEDIPECSDGVATPSGIKAASSFRFTGFRPVISIFLVALWPEMVLEFQSLCLCSSLLP